MKTTTLILTLVFTIMTAQPALADSKNGGNQKAIEEIKGLMDCYAVGSDILTRLTHLPPVEILGDGQNLTDDGFAEGYGYYKRCSTPKWAVSLEVLGELDSTATGPLEWANFHHNGSRFFNRANMQHLIRPVSVKVKGNRGVMEAYSIVHVMYSPDPETEAPATVVDVLTITYTSHVVRKRGRWLLDKTNLNLTSWSSSDRIL